MNRACKTASLIVPMVALLLQGCAASKIDFAKIQRPARAAELDAYNAFVGTWTWEAEMTNAEDPDEKWTGTAEWHWTLDNRTLEGSLSARSQRAEFDAAGVWSWNPKSKKYIWWMFNNWGYPQQGTAAYDGAAKSWRMNYRSIGLDGTTSYGCYELTVVDNDTIDWCVQEWADMLHLVKKMEMKGVYKRQ